MSRDWQICAIVWCCCSIPKSDHTFYLRLVLSASATASGGWPAGEMILAPGQRGERGVDSSERSDTEKAEKREEEKYADVRFVSIQKLG